ncbi:IS701 family transposase [Streptomyces sanglieri]|uniref:IS701 family transposase n=1 Tax=Streptomyces sanglieri TaxID=193460 RepID=A0ABW2WPR0_9ACTN
MVTSDQVELWGAELAGLGPRVAGCFERSEPQATAVAYVRGLLADVPRKNGWQLAEQAGAATPWSTQRLLGAAHWDADGVRDVVLSYVVDRLGEPDAVLVLDETGFLKKGSRSAGVQRQYTGTAGRIDRELYLPDESWMRDASRRNDAAVPEDVGFASKSELGRRMLARALAAGAPFAWVAADAVYGQHPGLREWCEVKSLRYAMAVPSHFKVTAGGRSVQVRALLSQIPKEAWERRSCGQGSKGVRRYDWTTVEVGVHSARRGAALAAPAAGFEHLLLVRRSIADPAEIAFFLFHAPVRTALAAVVAAVGARWSVEECFETAKNECGLDQYEVRKWSAWYRHILTSARQGEVRVSRVRPVPAMKPSRVSGRYCRRLSRLRTRASSRSRAMTARLARLRLTCAHTHSTGLRSGE